jgi:hypothetical protein
MTASDTDTTAAGIAGDADEDARVERLARVLYDAMCDGQPRAASYRSATERQWAMFREDYRRMARATLAHLDAERAEDEALLRDLWELLDSPPPSREWWPVMRRLHARLHGTYATGEEGADV